MLIQYVYTETSSFKVLYLLQVKSAFGLDSVKHSNESLDVSLMFTSVGETEKKKERKWAVIQVAEKIWMISLICNAGLCYLLRAF